VLGLGAQSSLRRRNLHDGENQRCALVGMDRFNAVLEPRQLTHDPIRHLGEARLQPIDSVC
jgi:hypothetical protein